MATTLKEIVDESFHLESIFFEAWQVMFEWKIAYMLQEEWRLITTYFKM